LALVMPYADVGSLPCLRYLTQRSLAPADIPMAMNKYIVATRLVAVKQFAWLAPLQVTHTDMHAMP
jgi:hypothetical protein